MTLTELQRLRLVDAALASARGLHVETLAAECGCSAKTIRRAIDLLGQVAGEIVCRQINADNDPGHSHRHYYRSKKTRLFRRDRDSSRDNNSPNAWTDAEIALLGTDTDYQIAAQIGRSRDAVYTKRRELVIPPANRRKRWTKNELALLGTMPDGALAERLGCRLWVVRHKRRQLGIEPAIPKRRVNWSQRDVDLLGTVSDGELAQRLGCNRDTVARKRRQVGVPAYQKPRRKKED